ncbi:Ribonuclease HII, partial [hydrothermal vent metagenome]
ESLSQRVDFVLIDGRDIPKNMPCKSRAVIGGDRHSLTIAAASIIAKVTRDQMCPIMDASCHGYEFAKHKGYGTKAHMEQLKQFGITKFHRPDFAPVAALIKSGP